jgi:hypothetical protein
MNDEPERIWKETALALSRYYPGTSLERLRKATETSIRIACVPVEVRTPPDYKSRLLPLAQHAQRI